MKLTDITQREQNNFVAAAITDILMNATDGKRSPVLVLPKGSHTSNTPILPGQCLKLTFNDSKSLFEAVFDSVRTFVTKQGPGVACLVYSVLLTTSLAQI